MDECEEEEREEGEEMAHVDDDEVVRDEIESCNLFKQEFT